MLILARKPGEEILIGDNIVVKIVAIEGKRIRIGIEADRSVPVVRGELLNSDAVDQPLNRERIVELQLA